MLMLLNCVCKQENDMLGHILIVALLLAVGVVLVRIIRMLEDVLHQVRRNGGGK